MIDDADNKTAELLPSEVFAYIRVSTSAQDVENQFHGITAYAKLHTLVINEAIKDTISGSTPWRDRSIGALIKWARPGTVIIVSEISRLARSTLQVLEIMQEAANKGLILHVAKNALVMDGSMQSKIIATVLGLAAEIEREFIISRTTEALAKRREKGLPMGRPEGEAKNLRLDAIAADLEKWRRMKLGMRSIARLANCSPGTLYKWTNRRHPEWLQDGGEEENPAE